MAAFLASYTGPTGQPRTVTIQANDIAEAKKLLRRRGIRIRELREASPAKTQTSKTDRASGKSWGSIEIKLFEKAPNIKDKAVFANKLSALVDAGVPIVRSLDLMSNQQKGAMFKRALKKVSLDVTKAFH